MKKKNRKPLITLAVGVVIVIVIGGIIFLDNSKGQGEADTTSGSTASANITLPNVVNGKQQVAITVGNYGYSPKKVVVKKDVPVELTFFGQGRGCAAYLGKSEFWESQVVEFGNEKKVSFLPGKAGTFKYACSMGMYTGTIQVV
jgi:plastocyanin